MKKETGIVKVANNKLVKVDGNTGLVIGQTYIADSGFEYAVGVRDFGSLKIIEEVGHGVAVSYLNGVKVLNEKGDLIIDKKIENGTHYSRETVRQVVLEEILKMLENAAKKEGKVYDRDKTAMIINEKLNDAYFGQSYAAVLDWAGEIGVEFI